MSLASHELEADYNKTPLVTRPACPEVTTFGADEAEAIKHRGGVLRRLNWQRESIDCFAWTMQLGSSNLTLHSAPLGIRLKFLFIKRNLDQSLPLIFSARGFRRFLNAHPNNQTNVILYCIDICSRQAEPCR